MQKILIVEDDRDIAANIADYLQEVDPTLSVVVKHEGFDGFSAAATDESVALAVLDIGLPGLDGLSLTRRLREIGWKKPIIMLTARDTVPDRVRGLESGADDYLVKPFDVQEVLLRIRVLLRRNQPQVENLTSTEILEAGEIEILPDTLETVLLNKKMKLTPTEFEILYCLMQHFNKPVTLATLLEEVWGYSSDEDVRMLRVHVGALRNKIEPDTKKPKYLHTVTNVGYKLTPFGEDA